jgi:hypothetical protein
MARNPVATAEKWNERSAPDVQRPRNDRKRVRAFATTAVETRGSKTAHDGPIAAAHIVPLSHARHRLLAPRRDAAVSFPKLT